MLCELFDTLEQIIPSYIQLWPSSNCCKGIFLGEGLLSSSITMTWRRILAMSSEVRLGFFPEAKHGKSEISTPHTLFSTKKGNSENYSTYLLLPLPFWKRSLPLFPPLSNYNIALRCKTQHIQNQHAKIFTYYSHCYFSEIIFSAYYIKTKLSGLWVLRQYGYFSRICLLGWMNHEIYLARPYFLEQSDFSVGSTFWCQIFSTFFYWGICAQLKQENIIIDKVSTNIFPICRTYFYVY